MSVWTSVGFSIYLAGDAQVTVRPKYKPSILKPLAIFCHGRGGTATDVFGSTQPREMLQALADAGYPVISIDAAGATTWGKDAAINAVGTAVTWGRANLEASTNPVVLLGQSMGFLTVADYASAHLASVAAVVGLIPVCDLQDMVTNNRGSFATEINAQYSGGYSNATYGAAHNPTVNAATKFAGLPTRLYYGSTDTTVIPSTVTGLATAIGATATAVSETGGHAQTTVDEVSTADVMTFVQAHT